MWKNKSSIKTKFLNKMILIVFVSIGLWCLIWIYGEYSTFKAESESLRAEHIHSQKKKLKKEVSRVITYVNDMRKQSEQKLEFALKERVYEARQIAMNIYQQNADSKDLPEIKKMIKDALRPIRFNDGRGYYFAVSMDGVEQLYPVSPEFEGKNLIGLQDSKGSFVIQDEIEVIKKKSEGFVKHFWTKPGKEPSIMYPKISFVKYFKPLNWYFGTGEYLDETKKQIQEEILNRIVNLRFGIEGYFFGSTYQGDSLLFNGKVTIESGSIWNLTDPNGVKIIQELRKAVENPEGDFVYYSWNKLNTSAPSPKISFVQGIPEWGWMIGAGVYLDTIERTILRNKAVLIIGLKKRITRTLLILAVLLSLIYFWSRRISSQIQESVDIFSSFLNKSSIESATINPNDIQLKEFRDIAISTNKMLEDRKQAEEALRESEAHLRTLIETIPDLIWLKDPDGVYISCNLKFERFFGAKETVIKGKTDHDFVDKELADSFREKDKAAIAADIPVVNEEEVTYADDGHKELLETIKTPMYDSEGKLVGVLGIARDITKRKHAENLVRDLSRMLMQAQERERKMISCELHDTIAQDLSTLKLYCDRLFEKQLSPESDIKGSPADVFKLIDQAITTVRDLAYELRPPSLDHLGLVHALEVFCEEFTEKNDIMVDFQAAGIHESTLNSDTQINLYRLVTEGLNNVRKHAAASKAIIRLVGASPNIILRIEDNGAGFDVKDRERSIGNEKRMGLRSMKERVNLLQGQMSIHSQLDKGTKIVIKLPL